jgi:hypothetical protein
MTSNENSTQFLGLIHLLGWEESDKGGIMARIVPNHSAFKKQNISLCHCRVESKGAGDVSLAQPRRSGKARLSQNFLRNVAPDFLQYISERLEVTFHKGASKKAKTR